MYDGLVTRRAALRVMTPMQYEALLDSGQLRRVFRGICIDPASPGARDLPRIRRRAALVAANGDRAYDAPDAAYLCCHSAAAEYDLPAGDHEDIFVGVPRCRTVSKQRGLVIHRHDCEEQLRTIGDTRAVSRELAVVQAFGVLPQEQRRQLVIRSLQGHLVSGDRVLSVVSPTAPRRRELVDLVELASGGSHSELEIRALAKVMQRYGIEHAFRRQYADAIPSRSVPMDFAAVELKIDVETDGSRYHLQRDRRAADVRRDLDLQQHGWIVVRCLWDNVESEPERVARAILATLLQRGWQGRPGTNLGRAIYAGLRH
jgi:very-short-patch-repair endonuclease